jgi:hypothetical protein
LIRPIYPNQEPSHGEPDESGVLKASMQCRRNWQLRLAGIALAFANVGICFLLPILANLLPIFGNLRNLGWLALGMAFYAIVHIPIILLFVLICVLVPPLRCRGGMATVVLALLPWVEWTVMIVFFIRTDHF